MRAGHESDATARNHTTKGRLDTPADARAADGKAVLHPRGQVWHDPAPRARGPRPRGAVGLLYYTQCVRNNRKLRDVCFDFKTQ